jgi:2-keto-4-pentenoate hydratase/2-oxohepta-3-ene-1,7-dioic acid hydratase in catechol pathway
MKFVRYEAAGCRRTGIVHGDSVVDVTALVEQLPVDEAVLQAHGIEPATGGPMRWAQAGTPAREQMAQRLREHLTSTQAERLPLAGLRLLAPVARPGKIVGVGRNYADHAKETGVDPFEKPRIIFKMPSSVVAPGAAVPKPATVQKFDFEGELAVVIGSFARDVTAEQALSHVAGYTLLNDLSAREFQFDISPPQTTFAKSMDGFCPLGPVLVTADEIPDPQNLRLLTLVNGQVMQEATTADMLFPVATLIAYVSQYMTLEPGDVLTTGTPAGIGAFRKPPVWLSAGDRIEVSIAPIGTLVTTIA